MLSPQPRTVGSTARRYKLISGPACEPIDFSLAQNAMGMQVNTGNYEVRNRISAVRRVVENFIRRPLVSTVFDMFLDDEAYVAEDIFLPWASMASYSRLVEITIGKAPVITVLGVFTTDDSGTETMVDPSIYSVSRVGDPCRIRLNRGQQWPTHRGFESFRIRFAAGFVTPFTIAGGFLIASNHGLSAGDTVQVSTIGQKQLNDPLEPLTPYTVMAIDGNKISLNDPDNEAVVPADTSDYGFIGEIPGDIIRAMAMLAAMDDWSAEATRTDKGNRYSAIDLPLEPRQLLTPYQMAVL